MLIQVYYIKHFKFVVFPDGLMMPLILLTLALPGQYQRTLTIDPINAIAANSQ